MRSAYSPVVRDTMDYSTALCDRNGRVVAQGLTLAVQLGTFPTVMGYVLEEFGSTRPARRRLHRERPVRLRRPASARHLRDQADLRRRRARGLRGDDGAPLRRRRHRAGQHRRPRDRDLPGGPPDPALEALRRRRREHDAAAPDRGEHAPAGARARRPPGSARGLPRRRAGADGADRALRRRRARLHGRAAAGRRADDAGRAGEAPGRRPHVHGLHRRRRRRARCRSRSACASRSRATRC